MATGKASDFTIYQHEVNAAWIEYDAQYAELFNEQSKGSIVMRSEAMQGDYGKVSGFLSTSSLVNERDTTDVSTAGTVTKLSEGDLINVKLNRYNLSEQTLDAWKKIAKNESELARIIGLQLAKADKLEKLNRGLGAVVGATGNVGVTVAYDAQGDGLGTMTHLALTKGLRLFGDRAGDIVCWVMHSHAAYDLLTQSIADKIDMTAGMAVLNGTIASLGRPIVITDSTELVSSSTYYTLGLTQGAIDIADSEPVSVLSEVVGGKINLIGRIQAEWAYNLGLRGYKYLVATGANPNAAAVRLGTNWPKVATSIKDTAGVRIATL
jgi:hypothetical protein